MNEETINLIKLAQKVAITSVNLILLDYVSVDQAREITEKAKKELGI